MFSSLATNDVYRFLHGVIILLLIIIIGVVVAEHQMNSLTQWNHHVQFLNIRHNSYGVYSFYVFGQGYSVCAVYRIGDIYADGQKINIDLRGYNFNIPLRYQTDISKINLFWENFIHEFKSEAYYTKESFKAFQDFNAKWIRDVFLNIKSRLYHGGLQAVLS